MRLYTHLACVLLVALLISGVPNQVVPVQAQQTPRYKQYLPTIRRGGAPVPAATPIRTATPIATRIPTATAIVPQPTATVVTTPNPSGPDFTIGFVEVTQAVQTNTNSAPLVAGRATVVRIYARNAGPATTASVPVQLIGTRAGQPLPSSPLITAARVVPANPGRGDYASSYNIVLPPDWASGTVTLTAIVDPQRAVTESNETNNQTSVTVTFNVVPPLTIVVVPVRYTHQPSGTLYAAPTQDRIGDWLRRAYPLSTLTIRMHAPIDFSGDLGGFADWSRLLDLTDTIKQTEGAPEDQVYYTLIPTGDRATTWVNLQSFIAGIGFIGLRASAGLDYGFGQADSAGQVAGHEVGHNLGRQHAPCGAASGIDPTYPYAGASIGANVFGLDLSTNRVWNPGAPDSAKDLMSYCGPKWLSDYNYRAIFNQLVRGPAVAAPATSQSWLVRARFDQQGQPTLQPLYALDTPSAAAPIDSEWAVGLYDIAGQLIGQYPVTLYELHADIPSLGIQPARALHQEQPATPFQAIQAIIPRSDQTLGEIQLLHHGVIIAAQRFANSPVRNATPSAEVTVTNGHITLRWPGDAPALVRYSFDEQHWVTLGVDLPGGMLEIDPSVLPTNATGVFEILPAGALTPLQIRLGQ